MSVGQLELEPREQFDRTACVRFTVGNFIPGINPLGRNIEQRYLGDDAYTTGEGMQIVTRLQSVDLAVAQRLSLLGDPGFVLTNKILEELIFQGKQKKVAWGSDVVVHARQLGLVENVTPGEANKRIATNLFAPLTRGLFAPEGWRIFASRQGDPMLLAPSREKKLKFDIVGLDDLQKADPEFLVQQIRNYHELSAMASLAFSVNYYLGYHEISAVGLLPEFVRELGRLVDQDQQVRQTQSILLFLDYLAWTNISGSDLVQFFRKNLSGLGTTLPDGRSVLIEGYLTHMSDCPSETPGLNHKYSQLSGVYQRLMSDQVSWETSSIRLNHEQKRIITHPDRMVFVLPAEEIRLRQEGEKDRSFSDFVTNTTEITDQRQLLQALRRELPDLFQKLAEFGKWFGIDYFGKSQLDAFILGVARTISSHDPQFSLAKLQQVSGDLGGYFGLSSKETFDGVFIDLMGRASISDPYLKAVISLLSIKSSQVESEGKKQESQVGDFYAEKVMQCRELTGELAKYFGEEEKRKASRLQELAEEKTLFAGLISQIGITDEEMTDLSIITKENRGVYKLLFNLILLHKQGVIDMRSPAFKEFLKFYFPSTQELFPLLEKV